MPLWQESKKALIISAFLLYGLQIKVAIAAGSDCDSRQFDEIGIVETVYDGDTIKLRDGRNVRLIGINTPELSHLGGRAQPYATEAKLALQELLPVGSEVGLRYDAQRQDHHRRTLAHLYGMTGQNLSVALLRQGLAFAIVVPPNIAHVSCYFAQEHAAREAKRGIWSSPAYRPKVVTELNQADTGFQYVEGTVTRIGEGKQNIWLDMGKQFSVRIQAKHLQYFREQPIAELMQKRIRVRGWVTFYNDKLRINIGHPAMLEIVSTS